MFAWQPSDMPDIHPSIICYKLATSILKIQNPTNVREVQRLNSKLASLSRFLSRLVEKSKPFYKLLRKIEPFLWDETCEQAFLDFKKDIVTPLVLSQPKLRVLLLLYILVTKEAISSALIHEEGKH